MTREERLELLKQIEKDIHVCSLESTLLDDAKSCAIHSAIEELEQEPKENLAVEQIKWERDVAIEQLKELGYSLGEKNRTGEDCISRQAVLDMSEKIEYKDMWHMTQEEEVVSVGNIKALPPVKPKQTDVLDKIRAEINMARFVDKDTRICKNALSSGLEVAMQIIDKYKAESEVQK